jgi:hypothetical protein
MEAIYMEKYIVVSRDYLTSNPMQEFEACTLVGKDSEEAWEVVEESVATNNSQEWLLSFEEARALYDKLGDLLRKESEVITQDDLNEYTEWKEAI